MFRLSDWQVLLAKRSWLELAYDSYFHYESCILHIYAAPKQV